MKQIVFIILMFAFSLSLVAQDTKDNTLNCNPKKERKVYFIPQVGLNFSKFIDEPSIVGDDLRIRTGYQVGVSVRTADNIFFQPGIYYSRQGNQLYYLDEINNQNIRTNVDFNVLKVPLCFGIRVLNVRAYTGFSASFLTKVSNNEYGFNGEDFSKVAAGFVLGGGVKFYKFTFDINYEFGLNSIAHDINSKVNILSFCVGIEL